MFFFVGCKGLNYLSKDITIKDKERFDYLISIFPSDSGHICSKKGVTFLLMNHLSDTLNSEITLSENDTIGRYFKDKNNQVFFCIADKYSKLSIENNLLFQFNILTKHMHIERYCNYSPQPYCWNNGFDGFERKGDLYCYLDCPTPIGQYYEREIYVFKNVKPQFKLNTILESNWFLIPEDTIEKGFKEKDLQSEIQVINDTTVLMHYKFEFNQLDTALVKIKTLHIEQFDIEFKLKNNSWFTLDSNKFEKIY
jgi:hypothetical protein